MGVGPSGADLLAAVQVAQKALYAWLAREFPIGWYVETKGDACIDARCRRGKIVRYQMDAEGNPSIEAQTEEGSLFVVNPLRTDVRAVPAPQK
jgi:hypothetical protein